MQSRQRASWLDHVFPVTAITVAVVMLALTPFWAMQWAHEPFLGALFEPNNIVSQIAMKGWYAREHGVEWSDQLAALNGQPVHNTSEMRVFLIANGFAPVEATFVEQTGEPYTLTITPTRVTTSDLFSVFILPYLVGLAFLATGVWAYRIRSELRASRTFVVFTAAIAVMTSGFLDMSYGHYAILPWALSLFVIGASLAQLALVFPQPMPFVERTPVTRYLPWVIAVILGFRSVRELMAPTASLAYVNTWIAGYIFIIAAILLFFATTTVRIFSSHSPMVRQQSRVIIFGGLLAFLPAMFLVLIPIIFGGRPEFNGGLFFLFLAFLPLSVMYAIVRYRLLDVDRLLSRALTYMLTIGVALGAFYALIALVSFLFQRVVGAQSPMVIGAFLVLLAVGLIPARDAIQRGIDRLFYRSPADYRRALTNLSRSLVLTPDLNQVLQTLEEQLYQALSPTRFVIYLYNEEYDQYFPHSIRDDSSSAYPVDEPLVRHVQKAAAPFWLSPGASLPPDLAAYPNFLGFTFVPLRYEGRLIGFFVLGPRRSDELYTSDDLDFLAAVADQSTLALENARLFTNLRRTYDKTLEMKNLMDDIFASIETGVITADLDRKITLFNRAAEHILGIPMKDVIGQPLGELIPSLRADLDGLVDSTLQSHAPVHISEIVRPIPARGELSLSVSCSPMLDAYQEARGVTIFFEDLTERRRLEAEQERIRQTFGRVVAPRVRDRLLADPRNLRLDGTQQIVTILFADLSGFTAYSERLEPETVFKVLNSYLALAADAVLEEEGTLDKFMGDAVLAIWNSPDEQPDHALRAVRAAQTILHRSIEAHKNFSNPLHRLIFRVGIATGPAIIGNVGTNELFNYTAIGDTVNQAQRLQVTAGRGEILMLDATYEIVRDAVHAEPLELFIVRGREQPVQAYRFLGLKSG